MKLEQSSVHHVRYGAGTVLARTRSIILERERRESWAQKAALEGKL